MDKLSFWLCSLFAAVLTTAKGEQHIMFKDLEKNLLLDPDSTVSIGNASDVFIDLQCLVTGSENNTQPLVQWIVQPGSVTLPSPLTPDKTSFNREDGVLRVYSVRFSRRRELRLQCVTATNTTAELRLRLYPTVFFRRDLPSMVVSSQEILRLCNDSVPSHPPSVVTVERGTSGAGTSYSYCGVETERGWFRSRSAAIGMQDTFSRLVFATPFPPEVVHWATTDSQTITLSCQVGGVATLGDNVNIFFLRNGEKILSSEDEVRVGSVFASYWKTLVVEGRRGNEGVYQCVGLVNEDGSTAIVTSTYINIQYLEDPTITISSNSDLWRPDNVVILGQTDTPAEIVLNCSVEAHPTPSISWTRRDGEPAREVKGQQGRTGYRERAFSEVTISVSGLKANVEFTCTAGIGDHIRSTSINITAYSPVQFTEQPTPLASHTPSNQPFLTCTATSIPIPTITWFRIRNGTARQLTDGEEGVSVSAELGDDKCSVRSTLQLATQITDHETMEGYYCMGDNGFFKIDSSTLDPLQYVPATPKLSVKTVTARSVHVEWTPPTSLLAIDHYQVTLHQQLLTFESTSHSLTAVESVNISAGLETGTVFHDLRPFSVYVVEVVASDVANNSSGSGEVRVKTQEDAPEAAPEDIVAESLDTNRIRLTWSPPPTHLQNGVVRAYSILYHPTSDSSLSSILNDVSETQTVLDLPLGGGISYTLSVAAVTVARGPFSDGVVQKTYSLPPSFSSGPPVIAAGSDTTQHTLPIQLPPVNITQFSHFWVVVVKIGPTSTSQISPGMKIQHASQPTPPPPNTPYVVAEMSVDSYQQSKALFVIGDQSKTQQFNNFPDLYKNLPLEPGSTYTAFIRGFSPYIPPSKGNGRVRKGSEESVRQYSVYTSSDLLPTTATLSAGGDEGSSSVEMVMYGAIGVGCVLVLLVIVVILVIRRKLRTMNRRHTGPADETKYGAERNSSTHSSRGQNPTNDNNTLPRNLTVTGEGIKHEEHIYADPLELKDRESYLEPIYKVPRPVSLERDTSDDAGYEVITPVTRKPRNWSKIHSHSERQRKLNEAPTNGHYELMQHPSSLGGGSGSNPSLATSSLATGSFLSGSPAPYLRPVGVSDLDQMGYSQLTGSVDTSTDGGTFTQRRASEERGGGTFSHRGVSEERGGYANLPQVASDNGGRSTAVVNHTQTAEYVVMKSAS